MGARSRNARGTNLRTKVVALLASLAALWIFAAWVTLQDGLNLLWVQSFNSKIFEPSDPVLLQLQQERRLSLVYLARPERQQREALEAARQRTDEVAEVFEASAAGWQIDVAASGELKRLIAEADTRLNALPAARAVIDGRNTDRAAAAKPFTDLIDSIFGIYDALGSLDDKEISADVKNLTDLSRGRELLSQEDALLAGVLATGRISTEEHAEFTQLVGAQRLWTSQIASRLAPDYRATYDKTAMGETFIHLREMEDRITSSAQTSGPLGVTPVEWDNTTGPALAELRKVVLDSGDDVVSRTIPVAILVVVRLVLAAGLGLLAVIASIVVSITTARALVAQLTRLRGAARRLAEERLPDVVTRIGRGEVVDVAVEAPPLDFGDDEIGQVGKAFNAVQETAIRTAVEQAELRRSVRDVFLSLARRTQALVHRQLTLLDTMERREADAEDLEDLFRIDHLATRMRRNAENLIVLTGSTPGRSWRRNVPMIDVIRGAVAEVEDYARVTVQPTGSVGLAGRAVGDIIHLLAELIENALSFSPPHTAVEVRGELVTNGFVIEIEDRGLGMSEEDRTAANAQIASQQEFNLANAARLGLYVVSRLTERHGVRAHLKESPYGGTTAVVLIPQSLVTDEPLDDDLPGDPSPGGDALTTTGPAPADERRPGGDRPALGSGSLAVADPPARSSLDAEVTRDAGASASGLPTRTRTTRATNPAPAQPHPATPGPDPADGVGQPTADGPRSTPETTPSGLPFRVRQASLAAPLREERPAATEDADDEDVAPRPPDQVRRMMSSYQTGTIRGRSEAKRLMDEDTVPLALPRDTDPPQGGNQPAT